MLKYAVHMKSTQQSHLCGNMLLRGSNILNKSYLTNVVLYKSQSASAPSLCLPLFVARDLGRNGDSHFEFYSSEPGLGLPHKEQMLGTPHLLQTLLVSVSPLSGPWLGGSI